jgi:hypothetical protein
LTGSAYGNTLKDRAVGKREQGWGWDGKHGALHFLDAPALTGDQSLIQEFGAELRRGCVMFG